LTQHRHDHLSNLAPELVSRIFQLVYQKDDPNALAISQSEAADEPPSRARARPPDSESDMTPGPISKLLLPFARAGLYHHIVLRSLSSFRKLCTTIANDPSLGELVLELDLVQPSEDQDEGVWDEDIVPGNERLEVVTAALLGTLVNLQRLRTNVPELAKVLLMEHVARSIGPKMTKLTSLTLVDPFRDVPFDPDKFKSLRHYPSLSSLYLHRRNIPGEPSWDARAPANLQLFFICAPGVEPAVLNFVRAFPVLDTPPALR
jgi:hypothetical protein